MSWTFSNPISAVKSDTPHRSTRSSSTGITSASGGNNDSHNVG
jgi:hypothetical protein